MQQALKATQSLPNKGFTDLAAAIVKCYSSPTLAYSHYLLGCCRAFHPSPGCQLGCEGAHVFNVGNVHIVLINEQATDV